MAPYVRVFEGTNPSNILHQFLAYGLQFMGGVFVAAGDVTGDGKADIVTGPGPGGGPTVRVFDSNDTSEPIGGSGGFRAYGDEMTAGVRVGAVDVDGDGRADVLTAPGGGHVVTVKAFNAADLIAGVWQPAPLYAFDAYPSFTGGAFVSGNGANWVETLYTWDHRNRLTAVTERDANGRTTKEVEYTYDLFDRRIAKDVDDDGNGTIDRGERYVYDGEDIALVFDGAGSLENRYLHGPGSLENRYLHGPGIDEFFADEDALGEILWALTDNQGTVRAWARSDGTIANEVTYDAFGRITGQESATHEPLYAYTGREWDADAGMYYYRARWYDGSTGTFLGEDPIGFWGDDANLYRYVLNSPTNFTDPSGLLKLWGQRFVLPWDSRAGGFTDTVRAYGRASLVAGSGLVTGAAAGAGTGAAAGAIIGGVPTGGIGAGPGALAGAGAGGLTGGAVGLITSMGADDPLEAAKGAAIPAGVSGIIPGAGSAVASGGRLLIGPTLAPAVGASCPGAITIAPAVVQNGSIAVGTALGLSGPQQCYSQRQGTEPDYPEDRQTGRTTQRSANFNSEGEARNTARQMLGRDPIKFGDNKWRSADGKWQYRAKPVDTNANHIHLERLDPATGEVLENWHFYYPAAGAR